jgi:hypothetical protein
LLVRGVVAVALALFAGGCGPATLDATSPATLERTAKRMRVPMDDVDSVRFEEALLYLVGTPWLGRADAGATLGDIEVALLRPLDGHTSAGIVAEARRRRLLEVRSAVTELETRKRATAAARRDLGAFRFSQARVFKRNRGYLEWPVIEFRLENLTNHFVWMVSFRAVLLKPGDHRPWLIEDFELVFFEGLAPGEGDMWRVEPEQQEWIQLVDPHPDLEFVLEPMRLETIGGRVLCQSNWGVVESRRLQSCEDTLRLLRGSDSLVLDRPPLPSLPPIRLAEISSIAADQG